MALFPLSLQTWIDPDDDTELRSEVAEEAKMPHTSEFIYSCCAIRSAPSPPGSLWEVGRGEQAFPALTAHAGMQDGHVCCRLFARMSMGSELVSERPPNHASGVKASALAEATPPWDAFPCLCLANALGAQL